MTKIKGVLKITIIIINKQMKVSVNKCVESVEIKNKFIEVTYFIGFKNWLDLSNIKYVITEERIIYQEMRENVK